MSKGNTTEADIIAFIFNATSMPSYGANLYLALYTGDPGESGSPNTNETAYTNYARQAVSRDAAGFTCAGGQSSNTALVQFPQCGATAGGPITHVGLVTSASGATGQILYSGALDSPLTIATLVQPQFAISALQVVED